MDDKLSDTPAPAGWQDSLAKSEAQLAAGESIPAEQVMRRLGDSLARMQTKQAAPGKRKAAPPR